MNTCATMSAHVAPVILSNFPMARKIYANLIVKVIVELDDSYDDLDVFCAAFIGDYSFTPSDGASFVDTEIVDIEITDSE